MIKPILNQILPFDSTLGKTFDFQWNDNFQAVKNKLVIRNNVTNDIVYNETMVSMVKSHSIPQNVANLLNGGTYNAVISVFDSENNESLPSDAIIFKCFTTPSWYFSNLIEGQIIQDNVYNLQLIYGQLENELLNSFSVSLYDSGNILIHQSETFYNPTVLEYTLSNLEHNKQYSVIASGETVNGMRFSTTKVTFQINYIKPELFALVGIENIKEEASIKISYNVEVITGTSNLENPIYITLEDPTEIDLTADGAYVQFSSGYDLLDNNITQIIMRKPTDYKNILEYNSGNELLEIKYMRGFFASQVGEKAYFILRIFNSIVTYIVYSNYIDIPNENDQINIFIKRINGLYSIYCEILAI